MGMRELGERSLRRASFAPLLTRTACLKKKLKWLQSHSLWLAVKQVTKRLPTYDNGADADISA